MSAYILGQVIGGFAVVVSLSQFQIDHRRKMLLVSTLACLLFAIGFFLAHAYTGSILNIIAAVRSYTFSRTVTKKGSVRAFILFGVISVAATLLTWDGAVSLFALAGTLGFALSQGQLRMKRLRRVALCSPPLWFAYNILTGFYPGAAVEVLIVVSNLAGQYRFDAKRKPFKRRQTAS